jgi:hypothetical protein
MADLDVEEMFLHFSMHTQLRELCGVDLSQYVTKEKDGVVWEVWTQAAMGIHCSPYQAVQGLTVAEELMWGDPSDPTNIFRWSWVRLNLPGSTAYDPSLPWVFCIHSKKELEASSQPLNQDCQIASTKYHRTGTTEYTKTAGENFCSVPTTQAHGDEECSGLKAIQ